MIIFEIKVNGYNDATFLLKYLTAIACHKVCSTEAEEYVNEHFAAHHVLFKTMGQPQRAKIITKLKKYLNEKFAR